MIPNVSSPLQALSVGGLHHWASLWKITRRDGVELFFTDHDQEIELDGDTYLPGFSSFTASARQLVEGSDSQNLDVRGAIVADSITEADLRAGKYREAQVTEKLVDWRFPWAGNFLVSTYRVEETEFDGQQWTAQLAGLKVLLRQSVGEVHTLTCRWRTLGNTLCGVNLASFTQSGKTVSDVPILRRQIVTDVTGDDGFFSFGKLTWVTGANAGLVSEVKLQAGGVLTLQLPTTYAIQNGDTFNVVAGCDRLSTTCKDKFNNLSRFGGFPFLPGNDKLFLTPSSEE